MEGPCSAVRMAGVQCTPERWGQEMCGVERWGGDLGLLSLDGGHAVERLDHRRDPPQPLPCGETVRSEACNGRMLRRGVPGLTVFGLVRSP